MEPSRAESPALSIFSNYFQYIFYQEHWNSSNGASGFASAIVCILQHFVLFVDHFDEYTVHLLPFNELNWIYHSFKIVMAQKSYVRN